MGTSHDSLLINQRGKEKILHQVKLDDLLRGDYQSRMQSYATGRHNGWMSANDIRELNKLDKITAEEGCDMNLVNGNMLQLNLAGAFANNTKEIEDSNEEILKVEEPIGTNARKDTLTHQHNR